MKKIVLASHNAAKVNEFQSLFAALDIDILAQNNIGVEAIDEPFMTFVENALLKARHASELSGLPALADDSGLCVYALQGAPGVLSARYAGRPKSDARNNNQLLKALAGESDRRAYYYTVLVLVRHRHDPQPIIMDGRCDGEILSVARGNQGFGYDPLFWVPTCNRSMAELTLTEKSLISHRGQALRRLIKKLREEMGR